MADSLTRRQLLKGTSVAGLSFAFPQVLVRGQGAVPANDRVQMAVIGAGARGRVHLETLLGKQEVQVVAIVDVDDAHAKSAKLKVDTNYGNQDAKIYADFRELIAKGGIDAVVIAVPNHWNALIAIACLAAGIDVYGEAPLAHTLAEGRAICNAVNRFGRVWQTGSQRRSEPLFQRACGLVASGRLGVTRTVEVGTLGGFVDLTGNSKRDFFQDALGLDYELWLGPAPWLPYHPGRVHENWRWHQAFGGGQLLAWSGHYVDIALWAVGLDRGGPRKLEATGTFANHTLYNVPVSYDIEATFANDMIMRVSSQLAPGVRWHGDDGWIYVTDGQIKASSPDLLNSEGADDWAMNRFTAHGRDHWQDFLDSVRTRRPPVSPCESAHRAASIGHLGLLALNAGRPLTWKPDKETIVEDPNAAGLLEVAYRAPWILRD